MCNQVLTELGREFLGEEVLFAEFEDGTRITFEETLPLGPKTELSRNEYVFLREAILKKYPKTIYILDKGFNLQFCRGKISNKQIKNLVEAGRFKVEGDWIVLEENE